MNNKAYFYERDCREILDLMERVETRTGKMFHETHAELERTCMKALSGETHASFVINTLCKLIDELEEGARE